MTAWQVSDAVGGRVARVAANRRDTVYLLAVLLSGIAVGVVNTFTTADDLRDAGRPIPFWEPAVWEATSVIAMIALAPAVMAFTHAVRPFAAPWWKVVALHAVASVAFSAAHVAGMGVLRWIAYSTVGSDYGPVVALAAFGYELRKDVLTYVTLVALYVGWLRLSSEVLRGARTEPPAIEVRDGPRRHFVPLSEVVWIEAAGNYVELHRGATPILHRAPLSQLERDLEGMGFVRIHRSRLVRRDAVTEVESKPSGDYVVRLNDGRELAGSRRFRRPLLEP